MKKNILLCYDQYKIGALNQCRGFSKLLSENQALNIKEKPISLPLFWPYAPIFLALFLTPKRILKHLSIEKSPDLIVASGRQSVMVALSLRRRCPSIILQNPRINPKYFDLVIAPRHDKIKNRNITSTLGSLHHLRKEELEERRVANNLIYSHLPKPYITVLIGGDSRHYIYQKHHIERLMRQIEDFINKNPLYKHASFLITASRRTRPDIIERLKNAFKPFSHHFYEGKGLNPYLDYIALADAFIVTSDSINMITEACFQGKPVYIYELPLKNKKFKAFLSDIYKNQHAVPLGESLKECSFYPLDESERIKKSIIPKIQSLLS